MQSASRLIRLMGTRIEVHIWHEHPEPILNQVEELLYLYQERFSANDLTSELMEVNLNAGVQAVSVSQELYELITLGKEHSLARGSFLNITIGPLVQAWRIGFKDAKRPPQKLIEERLRLISPQEIDLSPVTREVYLRKEGMSIDLGALAKGYVADKIIAFLKAMGVRSGYINLGGNVKTVGLSPYQEDGQWRIGLRNPQGQQEEAIAIVIMDEGSLVTSGTYERVLELEGKTYHHILDSQTGYPIQSEVLSLTILSEQSIDGEIWTSRLFGQPLKSIYETIESQSGLEGLMIDRENRLYASSGLRGKIISSRPIIWNLDFSQLEKTIDEGEYSFFGVVDVFASASQGGFGHQQWTDTITGASAL